MIIRLKFSCLLFFLVIQAWANSDLHLVPIGDLKTVGGETIKQCVVGYRLIGHFNPDKSNTIIWPTWYTGTSENVSKIIPSVIDTSRFAVIVVDALGNGVSSSPSNSANFPAITIRDMVNSQHELLVNYFKINHVYAVGGISMGGMQTLEWLVTFPDFMDRAISIVGTPKQSFHDQLLWNTELELIRQAEQKGDKTEIEQVRKRIADIQLLELYTPDFFLKKYKADDLKPVLSHLYEAEVFNISNLRSQLEAMIGQDIYLSSGKTPELIGEQIKAKVLFIVAINDHMVNPESAINLARNLGCKLELVDNECGHNLLDCGSEQVRSAIASFITL
ncbi:MAG: alpha/beta fold hydrolase [Prolixibacteraceae bacterium]|nr:alpha/beta fold hydrolase [Prolixibacteraceae bacterium]